jgi:hypothetical protein
MHPSNGKTSKHFNRVYPQVSLESRNMCFGLCTDIFNPFGSFTTPYSSWPEILTMYNLPLKMCMRLEFMFLSMVILSPNSSSWNINDCLHPLIDELKQL